MREIQYKSPSENKIAFKNSPDFIEGEHLAEPHTFKVYVSGKVAGVAIVDYYSKPLPIYQLTTIYTEPEFQKQGIASDILNQVEKFAKDRKKPIVLIDAIIEEEPDENGKTAKGMYARRGWVELEGQHGRHVFNWPKNIPTEILRGFESRQTDYVERESFKKHKV